MSVRSGGVSPPSTVFLHFFDFLPAFFSRRCSPCFGLLFSLHFITASCRDSRPHCVGHAWADVIRGRLCEGARVVGRNSRPPLRGGSRGRSKFAAPLRGARAASRNSRPPLLGWCAWADVIRGRLCEGARVVGRNSRPPLRGGSRRRPKFAPPLRGVRVASHNSRPPLMRGCA